MKCPLIDLLTIIALAVLVLSAFNRAITWQYGERGGKAIAKRILDDAIAYCQHQSYIAVNDIEAMPDYARAMDTKLAANLLEHTRNSRF